MAIVRAVKTGVWSDVTTWNTGALPTSADDVYSNAFTVTIDVSPTVLSISNASATGVTAGGGFTIGANGITLTCTAASGITGSNATNTICIDLTISAGSSATLVSNVNGGSANTAVGVRLNGSGTLSIVGNCLGASAGSGGHAVLNNIAGTINITGNVNAGLQGTGLTNFSTGTVNVTGNVLGAANFSNGIVNSSSGVLNVTGNVLSGSSGSPGAGIVNNSGTATVVGQVAAIGASNGFISSGAGAINVLSGPFLTNSTGLSPVYAVRWFWANSNVSPTYYQIRTQNLATIRPLYTADSVGGNPAVGNVRSGTVYGPSNELTGTCAVPAASSVLSGVPVDNTTGTATISSASIRSALGLASANLDAQFAAIPAAPSAASVASAVWSAVTRTVTGGTVDTASNAPSAATIASAVWAAATRTLSTTIPQVSDIVSGVWAAATRSITGGTVDTLTNAPSVPSAATIAAAVWAAADKTGYSLTSAERTAIATAVEQSILNEGDGQQVLNAIVGAIGNTNVDQIALVAAIRADLERTGGTLATRSTLTAAQVRTELTPELANLDATVSSRLPSSGYTAPPSAASIASAVWANATRTLTTAIDNSSTIAAAVWSAVTRTLTSSSAPSAADNAAAVRQELGTELARLANAATTQEVGDIVEASHNN